MGTYPAVAESLDHLVPLIVAARDHTEAGRRVPAELGTELGRRGFGRLLLPTEAPGHELAPDDYMTVLERLAAAEASVALVVWNNGLPALVSRHLDDDARAEIFSDPVAMYANSTRPSGRAVPTADGIEVTGRWSLVTGCQLAGWFALMCMEWDPRRDEPAKSDRRPHMMMAFVPATDVEIVDTWHAAGVRGSGSHDLVVEGVTVPRRFIVDFDSPNRLADRPLGRMRWMSLLAAGHAAISIGIAQAASTAFVELMATKVATDSGASPAEHPAMQVEFLDAHSGVAAARDRARGAVAPIWRAALDGVAPSTGEIADVFGAARLASRAASALTEVALRWGGTSALYTDTVIERAWRDVTAIGQHVIVSPLMAEQAGRIRLGLAPRVPSFTW